MSCLFVFFLIFCLSVGFVTLVLSIVLLGKIKSKLSLYFILFLAFFLIIIFIASLLFFLELFMEIPRELDFILSVTSQIIALAIDLVMILFMYGFLQIFENKRLTVATIIILIILSASIILFYLYIYVNGSYDSRIKTFNVSDIVIFLLPFYPIILFFSYYKRIKEKIIARIIRPVIIVAIFFLPILLLENFELDFTIGSGGFSIFNFRVLTFPLFYLVLNLIFFYYGFQHIHMIYLPKSKVFCISEEFIRKFNITNREKELICLIYEGCSNKQIGNRLFISPATVRNHLHNIYEKTGSKNRVDLLHFCIQ